MCRENYDLDPASLPPAAAEYGAGVKVHVIGCDACLEKGLSFGDAVVYCKSCARTFCSKHQEVGS